ncbi:hypothetical protein cyc_08975 [Cyclospora cayetanensis]|uniref:Uncharacterized protein n=1 Tax=Cyclospora cayetanensis TaxID=88456 RepID=A0A1D3CVX8_9EIME|nr:hypothetical protein cyc_08975 [Cyclospora cayetanensis]
MIPYLSGDTCVTVLQRCLAAVLPSAAATEHQRTLLQATELQRRAAALPEQASTDELLHFLLQQQQEMQQQEQEKEDLACLTLDSLPPLAHRLSLLAAAFGSVSPLLPAVAMWSFRVLWCAACGTYWLAPYVAGTAAAARRSRQQQQFLMVC